MGQGHQRGRYQAERLARVPFRWIGTCARFLWSGACVLVGKPVPTFPGHALDLLRQKLLRVPGERRETRDPGPKTRELHGSIALGPGSRSGYAHSASKPRVNALMASAGTRKVCDAVRLDLIAPITRVRERRISPPRSPDPMRWPSGSRAA